MSHRDVKRTGTRHQETPSDERKQQTIDGTTGKVEDPPPQNDSKRRIDLSSLRDVRLELAAVYRKMDAGEIETADGTKRAYVLRQIADVIEIAELERRLQELEERQGIAGGRLALPQHVARH